MEDEIGHIKCTHHICRLAVRRFGGLFSLQPVTCTRLMQKTPIDSMPFWGERVSQGRTPRSRSHPPANHPLCTSKHIWLELPREVGTAVTGADCSPFPLLPPFLCRAYKLVAEIFMTLEVTGECSLVPGQKRIS
eukprot:1161795-Pelagomonas_calceolata.AAC.5